jgi:peptide/nickel transport system permease protein
MYRLLPGGPTQAIKNQLLSQAVEQGRTINEDRIERLLELYVNVDPNKPIHLAYIDYMSSIVLELDFGRSITYNEPVFDILFRAMPWSVFVSIYGLLLGFSSNVILGSMMAYKEGSIFDKFFTSVAVLTTSIPYYVGAILMLSYLAFQWGLFPTGGRFNQATTPGLNYPFMAGVLQHGALPILAGFIVGFGGGALGMRGNSIRVLGEDYLRVARLRGIGKTRLYTRYVARNAILPMYTGLMIGIAGIFSSGVIMERIFTYPGVGWYTFDALLKRDYPLLMGSFIFYTTITVIGIMIADMTYGIVDPRASSGDKESY